MKVPLARWCMYWKQFKQNKNSTILNGNKIDKIVNYFNCMKLNHLTMHKWQASILILLLSSFWLFYARWKVIFNQNKNYLYVFISVSEFFPTIMRLNFIILYDTCVCVCDSHVMCHRIAIHSDRNRRSIQFFSNKRYKYGNFFFWVEFSFDKFILEFYHNHYQSKQKVSKI